MSSPRILEDDGIAFSRLQQLYLPDKKKDREYIKDHREITYLDYPSIQYSSPHHQLLRCYIYLRQEFIFGKSKTDSSNGRMWICWKSSCRPIDVTRTSSCL